MKTKRSKACDISQKVKSTVYKRDGGLCIFCHRQGAPNAHIIARSHGGLGIEENIVTACTECHNKMDNTSERGRYINFAKAYVMARYPDWTEAAVTYDKWKHIKEEKENE